MNASPRKLKFRFPDHECTTLPEAGLSGILKLLTEAERLGFDVLLTIDQGFNINKIFRLVKSHLSC